MISDFQTRVVGLVLAAMLSIASLGGSVTLLDVAVLGAASTSLAA